MNGSVFKHTGWGIVFVLSHVLIFQYLSIFGAVADPVLIFVIWLCTKHSRTKVILLAAVYGLLQDALFDVWGLFMFSKVLTVFVIYNALARFAERRLFLWQAFVVMWIIAVIHNIFFAALGSFVQSYSFSSPIFILLVVNSLYTALTGAALYIFKDY